LKQRIFLEFGHTLLQDHLGLVGLFLTKSATACFEDFPQCVQAILVTELTAQNNQKLIALLILALKHPEAIARKRNPKARAAGV
jgi:hypothetical protein